MPIVSVRRVLHWLAAMHSGLTAGDLSALVSYSFSRTLLSTDTALVSSPPYASFGDYCCCLCCDRNHVKRCIWSAAIGAMLSICLFISTMAAEGYVVSTLPTM